MNITKIWIGQTHYSWTIVNIIKENNNTMVVCKCICGVERTKRPYAFKCSESCGCVSSKKLKIENKGKIPGNFKSLIGQKFNRLLVIEQAPSVKTKNGANAMWKCKCDCGNISIVSTGNLKSGVVSCGCFQKEVMEIVGKKRALRPGLTTTNSIYKNYQVRAKRKNWEFTLTIEHFEKLILGNCYYCNSTPSQICYKNNEKRRLCYNGIDRLNPSIGYSIKNCVTCCKTCNYGKNDSKLEDWLNHLKRLVEYRKNM